MRILVAGLAIFVIMRALGELLIYRPIAGSFSDYATEFLGNYMGFAVGWTYWLVWATTCMAEITVAGAYVKFWAPGIPVWVTSAVVLGLLFVANLVSVKLFGEAEFWFSIVKVTTILAMILIGIVVLLPLGFGPAEGPSVSNLWADGGVFPTGFNNALLSLQIVTFAYIGVELVGVTASEARNPKVTLRKAINSLPIRIGCLRRLAGHHHVGAELAGVSRGSEPVRLGLRVHRHPGRGGHRQFRAAHRSPVVVQLGYLLDRPDAPHPVAEKGCPAASGHCQPKICAV